MAHGLEGPEMPCGGDSEILFEYKGYHASVAFYEDDRVFRARVVNTNDYITIEGATLDEVRAELETSIDIYLEFCADQQREPSLLPFVP